MSDQKCLICDKPEGQHRAHDRACLIEFNETCGPIWHPVNRFTPAIREEKPVYPIKCLCGGRPMVRREKTNTDGFWIHCENWPKVCNNRHSQIMAYGTEGLAVNAWNTLNTPYPTGKEMLQAGGARVTLDDVRMLDESMRLDSDCPPNTLPFDLKKALAGADVVTRDGRKATDIKSRDQYLLATIGKDELPFNLNGRLGAQTSPSCLDLFLAAKESPCEQCHGKGWTVCHGGTEPCDKCRPEDCERFRKSGPGCGVGVAPPPPEAPRPEQSEIDRQIEVMRASKEAGAVVECRLRGTENEWELANPDWNWKDCDYRIRPASPAPPRRVFLIEHSDGNFYGVYWTKEKAEASCDGRFTILELIELTPEVRAKLGMGGEGV